MQQTHISTNQHCKSRKWTPTVIHSDKNEHKFYNTAGQNWKYLELKLVFKEWKMNMAIYRRKKTHKRLDGDKQAS